MRSNRKHTIDELERYIQMDLHEGWSDRALSEENGLLLNAGTFNDKVQRTRSYRFSNEEKELSL